MYTASLAKPGLYLTYRTVQSTDEDCIPQLFHASGNKYSKPRRLYLNNEGRLRTYVQYRTLQNCLGCFKKTYRTKL